MTTLQHPPTEQPETQAEELPHRRAPWALALAAVLVVALAGSAVAVAGWNNRQNTTHERALTQWRDAREQLAEHLDLAAVILTDAQEAGLADDALTELESAIAAATDLDLDIDPTLARSGDITRAREVVVAVDEVRVPLASATATVRDATAVHRAELGLQTVDQAIAIIGTALSDLDAATAEITDPLNGARAHLASSEGETGNNHAVRVALTDTIDGVAAELTEAEGLRDQAIDSTARLERFRAVLEEIKASPSTHANPEGVGPVHVADAGEELTSGQELAAALNARTAALRDHHLASLTSARDAVTAAEIAASTTSTGTGGGRSGRTGSKAKANETQGTRSDSKTAGGGTQGAGTGASSSGDGSTWVEESTDFCGGGTLGQDPSWWGEC